MKDHEELLNGNIKKTIWKFAIPSIISMVVLALYNIVDRIYVGNIPDAGTLAMTGIGLTAPAITVGFAFAMLIGVGASTLISIKLGAKKKEEANRVFTNALELMIMVTGFLMIVGWLLLKPILRGLGADELTMPYAFDYLVWIIGGTLFNNLSFLLTNCLRAVGYPKVVTVINVIGTGLNLILDPIFIFGLGMGIKGAAIATVISQLVAMAVAIWYFYKKRADLPIKIRKPNWKINWEQTAKIMSIGAGPFLTQIAGCVVLVLVNQSLLKYGGNLAIAAMTILFSLQNLIFLPIIGFSQGMQPIIGFNHGAKQYARIRKAVRYGMKVVGVFGIVALILVELTPGILVRVFTADPELIEFTSFAARIFFMTIPLVGWQVIGANYFQFTGKAKMSAWLSMLRQVILFIPLLFIMPLVIDPPVNGILWAVPVGDILATVVTLALLWQAMKKMPKGSIQTS